MILRTKKVAPPPTYDDPTDPHVSYSTTILTSDDGGGSTLGPDITNGIPTGATTSGGGACSTPPITTHPLYESHHIIYLTIYLQEKIQACK